MYNDLEFIQADGSLNTVAIPVYTTQLLEKIGFKRQDKLQKLGDVTIYPTNYFAPMDFFNGTDKTQSRDAQYPSLQCVMANTDQFTAYRKNASDQSTFW